jgi:hypothetical protein
MRKNVSLSRLPAMLILVLGSLLFASCAAWHYGYTQRDALNRYMLIKGNKDNFVDRRLRYHRDIHKYELRTFLQIKGNPAFIYEYRSAQKRDGIQLYYPARDSVYVFEAISKHSLHMSLLNVREMNDAERHLYVELQQPGDNRD